MSAIWGSISLSTPLSSDIPVSMIENLELSNAEISVCGYHINDETDVNANIRDVSQFDALKKICMGDYKYGVLWNKLSLIWYNMRKWFSKKVIVSGHSNI